MLEAGSASVKKPLRMLGKIDWATAEL
jgi:hypothetical protein